MIAWCDIETTGKNLETDVLLEIALVLTDDELVEVTRANFIIHHDTLPEMDPVAVAMHTKSGLLEDVKKATASVYGTADLILEFTEKHVTSAVSKIPLAGNNIAFDRKFLDKYMSRVNRFFHFRSVDVSSINELAKRWYPDVLKKRPKKEFDHRAMGDILESIEELRFYRREIFLKVPDKGKTLSLF